MPRKKRQTKKGPTVQFSTSAKSVDGKGSYESKLREWRKIRDNLETEATHQVDLVLKSMEDEISTVISEYVISMQTFDPVILDAPYELFVECQGDSKKLMTRLTEQMDYGTRRQRQKFMHKKPPLQGRPTKKGKTLKTVPEIEALEDNTSSALIDENDPPVDQNAMAFVTPAIGKLTVDHLATTVTGRKLKEGERTVLKHVYVSELTGSPIVDPRGTEIDRVEDQCDKIMQCLPKKYRQKLESKMKEAGAKITMPLQGMNYPAVTPYH